MRRIFRKLGWITVLIAAGVPCSVQAQARISEHPRVVESLRLLNAWLEAELSYERIPGISIAIVSDQELVWVKGYGRADVERGIPATSSTLYSGCSIAKLFTATAVMKLRDEGKLRLDDPLEKHLEWLRISGPFLEAGPITIAQVLTHSSGLIRDLPVPYWTGPEYPFPTREAIVRSAARDWRLHAPGTRYEYSNIGVTLAGEIVSKVSGAPYEQYVRQHIFNPLGMVSTSLAPSNPGGQVGIAQGYTLLRRDGTRQRVPSYQVQGLAAVAGLVSTVEDLARFASWQLRALDGKDDKVVQGNTLRAMHSVQFMPADSWTTAGYGYQLWRENDRTFVGHAGTCPGFQSQLLLRPQDKIATIVMINAQGVSPNRYTQRAYDILQWALLSWLIPHERSKLGQI